MKNVQSSYIATQKELDELYQCELDHTTDMGTFGDLSSPEGQEMLKPAIAIIYEDPQTVKAMTNNQYQKLMIVCWSIGSYMLYGWHNGTLKPLPLDMDYIESYLQTHET